MRLCSGGGTFFDAEAAVVALDHQELAVAQRGDRAQADAAALVGGREVVAAYRPSMALSVVRLSSW